jgi:hypothetical protein
VTNVRVISMGPGEWGVEVEEGQTRTGHTVLVPEGFLEDVGLDGADPEVLVQESIEFILTKEPSAAIPQHLSLGELVQTYPDYVDELQRRMT